MALLAAKPSSSLNIHRSVFMTQPGEEYAQSRCAVQDIQKLDDLYEELLWDPDDELQFSIEYLKERKNSYYNKT